MGHAKRKFWRRGKTSRTDAASLKLVGSAVGNFIIDQKTGPNKHRWKSFSKDKALKALWNMRVVETRAEQLLTMLLKGTV